MERIKVPLDSLDKPGILREMCALLAHAVGVDDRQDEIHRAMLELVAGTTREPVDFDAVDGEPVGLVVMMVGPASAAGYHVKTLGHISRALKAEQFRNGLSAAASAAEFRQLILDAEA